MLNLNLKHINEDFSQSSDLQDSEMHRHQSIRAENIYELNSNSDQEENEHTQNNYKQSFQIDHSLDDLSLDHDTFLENLQRERITDKAKPIQHNMYEFKAITPKYLTVDKNEIEMTLVQTQTAEEIITFNNITSNLIKIRFNECPFQIHTQKSLTYVQAKQVEIILEQFQEVSITFLIKPLSDNFGDIIQNVVVTSEFIGRDEKISPIEINFNIHYEEPHLRMKYLGRSEYVSVGKNRISVARLKANKLGEYSLELSLNEGCPKMNVSVETRGKMTSFTSSLTLNSESFSMIKLRKKTINAPEDKEKYVLLLKSTDSKLCFLIGVEFLS